MSADEPRYQYEVVFVDPCDKTRECTVVSALTPEGASECVRVILTHRPQDVSELIVRIVPRKSKG